MNELTYWITLTFIQGITQRRKNEIYSACYRSEPRISITQLFEDSFIWSSLQLSSEECNILANAKSELANNSFLAERLISQGYDIVPEDNPEFSKALKKYLKLNTPSVLFTKGNKGLMQEQTVAIVGSRNADSISLEFTKRVAKKFAIEGKVVVSGFAKGVDRTALDAVLEAGGKSIIVLPQGITTFASGFKQYYRYISQGRLLVVSAFHPNAPWSKEFAMRRNPFIYGFANEIYVAQSDDKGGTWSGVIDGLRKKYRPIFVRKPNDTEKNANLQLIQRGAFPVDCNGNQVALSAQEMITPEELEKKNRDEQIRRILENGIDVPSQTIKEKVCPLWSDSKMKSYLRNLDFVVESKKKNRCCYNLKGKNDSPELTFPE